MIDKDVRAELNEMWQRIIALEEKGAKVTVEPAPGTCLRGKYKGRQLEDIVQKDPQYVDWLERNQLAMGIGFNTTHVEAARAKLKAETRPAPHEDDDIPF